MYNQLAFIDEFGNNGLDFESEGVSTHFIVASIIIDQENLSEFESTIDAIRKNHFQKGEMKSSNLKSNDSRRIKVLNDLNEIDYRIFAVVVDKKKLFGEGFKYKGSFYKFLHGLVDRELFRVFPDIQIVADEHGGAEFKKSFISYVHSHHKPDLFTESTIKLSNSKSNLLVQLADIIAGTLGRCYDEKHLSQNRTEFLSILKSKIVEIRFWPNDYKPFTYDPTNFEKYDPVISRLGLDLADQFISGAEKSNVPSEIDQKNCLEYLAFYFRNISPERYVATHELMEQISNARKKNITMHYFRSKVIAKLRDNGLLIASSNKGYKLPSSEYDLFAYVNHSNSYIQPMIDRLLNCRNKVKLATSNRLDILDKEEFKYLKILINHQE